MRASTPRTEASATTLAPLVDPAAGLTAEELERYSRHIVLPEIGVLGQCRLKNARILVVGAGGLGSLVLLYLAAAGVGTLGIVDDDIVELSNLQRQVIHGVADVGSSKLASARDAVAGLNPLITVRLHDTRLNAANALELFAGYDLVVDGSDNFATRYVVSDAAAILGTPHVWGAVDRFDGQVSVFWEEHGPSYRDLYPEAPSAGSALSCSEGGVLGLLCAAIGGMMAADAVKLITGVGRPLLGRVLLFNALDSSWREITIARDPARNPISELVDDERLCGVGPRDEAGRARAITVQELRDRLAARDAGHQDFDLIDVREAAEYALGHIHGSRLVAQGRILSGEALCELSRNRDIVLYCQAGIRSHDALAELQRRGYARTTHLQGGLLAWGKVMGAGLSVRQAESPGRVDGSTTNHGSSHQRAERTARAVDR